jgi:hypothetical protein
VSQGEEAVSSKDTVPKRTCSEGKKCGRHEEEPRCSCVFLQIPALFERVTSASGRANANPKIIPMQKNKQMLTKKKLSSFALIVVPVL